MRLGLLAVAFWIAIPGAMADDWPQWMGPTRDGIWREKNILTSFPAGGPKKLWSQPIHGGYAGPAVANGKLYVMDYERHQGEIKNNPSERGVLQGAERVLCIDVESGKIDWTHSYNCPYSVSYPCGPRCTPTVDGPRIYTLGTMGHLTCLNHDGKLVWSKHLPQDYKIETPIWGFCGHPLVYENLLICLVGGDGSTAVAFDKITGQEVWKALSATDPGYCPPSIIRAGGVQQLLIWHSKSINALNPRTGERYWSIPLEPSYGMSIMMPRQQGDYLFAGGIGGKSALIKLAQDRPAAELVWTGKRNNSIYPVNSTPIVDGDMLYGVDQPGQLRGVEFLTGSRKWMTFEPVFGVEKDEDYRGGSSGTAFLIKNGGRYFIFGETGLLTIAELSKDGYKKIDQATLIAPTGEAFGRKVVWSCPAFAQQKIFVRNDQEIACFDLAAPR